jgi:hypothetical protein
VGAVRARQEEDSLFKADRFGLGKSERRKIILKF